MDGASLRSVKLFESLYKSYSIDVITYKKNQNFNYVKKCFPKTKFYFFSKIINQNKKSSYFGRLFSKKLPGFLSHDPELIAKDIDRIILKNKTYTILYYATQLMGQARLYSKDQTHSIIDLYEVYSVYSKSKVSNLSFYQPYFWIFLIEAFRIKVFEEKIIEKFQTIFVTCDENYDSVQKFSSSCEIIQISNGTLIPDHINISKGKNILMVANFEYSGNFIGIEWFFNNVWSDLKLRMDVDLVLVGRSSKRLKKLLENDPSVKIKGQVETLQPFYEDAFCAIIPLFNDGGTKTKLIEALAYGVPVVSTPIGAKGFEHMSTIKISEDQIDFANHIEYYFANKYPYKDLKKNHLMIKNNFTWKKIGEDLKLYMNEIISRLISN